MSSWFPRYIIWFDSPLNKRKIAKFEELIFKVFMLDEKPSDHCIAATIAMEENYEKAEK